MVVLRSQTPPVAEKPVLLRVACGPIAANENAGSPVAANENAGGPVAANQNAGGPIAANQNAEWSQKRAINLHTTLVKIYRD